jgi:hypothetical protein
MNKVIKPSCDKCVTVGEAKYSQYPSMGVPVLKAIEMCLLGALQQMSLAQRRRHGAASISCSLTSKAIIPRTIDLMLAPQQLEFVFRMRFDCSPEEPASRSQLSLIIQATKSEETMKDKVLREAENCLLFRHDAPQPRPLFCVASFLVSSLQEKRKCEKNSYKFSGHFRRHVEFYVSWY